MKENNFHMEKYRLIIEKDKNKFTKELNNKNNYNEKYN